MFHASRFAAGSSEHWLSLAGPEARPDRSSELRTGCAVFTLDALAAAAPFLPPPTHLKIDIDGVESRVVRGAARLLASPRLRHLLIEGRAAGVAGVRALLDCAGFRHVRTALEREDVGGHGLGRHVFRT